MPQLPKIPQDDYRGRALLGLGVTLLDRPVELCVRDREIQKGDVITMSADNMHAKAFIVTKTDQHPKYKAWGVGFDGRVVHGLLVDFTRLPKAWKIGHV